MDAPSPAPGEAIVLSHVMPTPIRLMLGGVGLGGTILLLVELGPPLWPPSVLTLFFGLILLGGLSVSVAFAAGSVLSPDQTWEIWPGRLTITYQSLGRTSVRTYPAADLDGMAVVSSAYDSDVETYELVCRLPFGRKVETGLDSTPVLLAILAFLRAPLATARGVPHDETWLVSPRIANRPEAEAVLSRLMAGRG